MGLILGTEHLAANVNQPTLDHGHKRTPIKVALLSLPPRTQSLLEFFFSNAGRGSFAATIEEQAETAIFDLDTPSSRDHWVIYNSRTGRPGIALAVKPQDVPGAVWVQKPVTPAALLAAAATLRAGPLSHHAPTVPAEPMPAPWLADVLVTAATAAPAVLPNEAGSLPELAAPSPATEVPMVPPVTTQAGFDAEAVQDKASATAELTQSRASADVPLPAWAQPQPQTQAADEASAPTERETPTGPHAEHLEDTEQRALASDSHRQPGLKSFWQRLFGTAPRALPTVSDLDSTATPLPAPASPLEAKDQAGPIEDRSDSASKPLDAEQVAGGEIAPPADGSQVPSSEVITTANAQLAPAIDEAVAGQAQVPSEPHGAVHAQAASVSATTAFAPTEPQLSVPSTQEVDLLLDAPTAPPSDAELAFFGPFRGPATDADAAAPTQRYEPENYLIGALREAYLVASKWQVPTQIDCDKGAIVVDAERNEVYCGMSTQALQDLASQPLAKRSKVQTLTKLEYGKAKQAMQADQLAASCLRLDDTLWRCALWASAGRMPAGADATRTVYLRHWPNLTRLTPLPHAPRLAAMWALRGSSVVDSACQFKIEQRLVIGFFNGVWALNLLTDDGSLVRRAQRKGARNRGLLTRLLGWLRG